MQFYILPIVLLMSVACFGADASKEVTIGISDGSGRAFARNVARVEEEKANVASIKIVNSTPYSIVARVEGFGISSENCQRQQYTLQTGGVNIAPKSFGTLQMTRTVTQFSVRSVLYQLYASALMVRVAGEGWGDIQSEAAFKDPFEQGSKKTFVVTGDEMDNGTRYILEIKNQ